MEDKEGQNGHLSIQFILVRNFNAAFKISKFRQLSN
mgnify:CR=1 FL=1